MRVLVCVPSSPESEAGQLPPKDLVEKMMKFNEEMQKAGVMVTAGGLLPTSRAKRLVFSGDRPKIVDGPFAESKEMIAGFWILEVRSLDEAVAWISKAPFGGGTKIDLRPLQDVSDWPEELRDAARGA